MIEGLKPLREARVLVTGHTGFKGAWAIALLQSLGAKVYGFSQPAPTQPSLFEESGAQARIEHRIGDIRDTDALHDAIARWRPDCILHLAAQSLVLEGLRDPVGTYATNVQGTVNVVEAARNAPSVRTLVVATSDKCYRPSVAALHEDDPLGGHDPYSASKACAELVVEGYRPLLTRPGAPIVATVRAGNVIGGSDWAAHRLFPDLARAMLADRRLIVRHPEAIRPWQHVLDALMGYCILLARGLDGDTSIARAWNFGPDVGRPINVREGIALFVRGYGSEVELVLDATAVPENPVLLLDSASSRKLLAWHPVFNAERAIAETATFYRRRAAGEDVSTLLEDAVGSFTSAAQRESAQR
jgi:CDP-glucose 4,6-dehydratase